jgi:catechol 2,3-dioxygenase-like lactoylglutathione lyase family enzyme
VLKNVMFTTIFVSDQDRALAFYTETLGLEKRADNPGPWGRFLTVAPRHASVEILLWPGTPGAGAAVGGSEPGTIPGPLFLESDDLAEEFELLRARGVTFEEPEPTAYPYGVRLTAIDPDGNRIALRQPSPRRGTDG